MKRLSIHFLILLVAMVFAAPQVWACADPVGVEGEIIMNGDFKVPQYCDGTNWIAMKGGGGPPPVPAGLIAHWQFDEMSGSTVYDSSGNDNHGTVVNGSWDTGIVGTGAIDLNGTDDYVIVGDVDLFDGATEGSWCLWLKSSQALSSTISVVRKDGSWTPFQTDSSYWASPLWVPGLVQNRISKSYVENDGAWHHYCIVYDGSEVLKYVDGVFADSVSRSGTIANSANPLMFGARESAFDEQYNGLMDDIRMYNRALDAGEIGDLFAERTVTYSLDANSNTTKIVPDGLVGHWRLDETDNITAYDSSGNDYDGTMQGTMTGSGNSESGIVGNALTFNGSGERIEISGLSLNSTNTITITAWINHETNVPYSGVVFSRSSGVPAGLNAHNEQLRYHWANNSATYGWKSGITIPKNKWVFVALVVEPAQATLYMIEDGVVTSNIRSHAHPLLSESDWAIGADASYSDRHFMGSIDDVRIYDRALDEGEITEIAAARDGISYNADHRVMQYFDGNDHVAMTLPWPEVGEGISYEYQDKNAQNCPNIGDECDNGTFYVGTSPDGGEDMFIAKNDLPGFYAYNNGTNPDTIQVFTPGSCDGGLSNPDCIEGESRADILAQTTNASSPYEAAVGCYNHIGHGASDWYLPSYVELYQILKNLYDSDANDTMDVPIETYNFASDNYATVTEYYDSGSGRCWVEHSGEVSRCTFYAKYLDKKVRCVRKGPAPVAAGTGGLVGHWKLDETSGTTVYDSSGNGNDGTLIASTFSNLSEVSVIGPQNKAIDFKGRSGSINVPFDATLNTQDVTIAAWIKFNTAVSVNRIVTKADDYQLEVGIGTRRIRMKKEGGTHIQFLIPDDPLEERWYHLAASFSDSEDTARFYIDGVYGGSLPALDSFDQDPSSVIIGSDSDGRQPLALDDVRIYNRILSAAEITQIYQMGTPVGASTALPQGCPNIGDVCDDGTIYAGFTPADGTTPMYILKDHISELPWNNGNSTGKFSTSISGSDGEANTNTLVVTDSDTATAGFQPHQAAQACYELNAHGTDDWYLPSESEFSQVMTNNDVIINVGSFYWFANEQSTNNARSGGIFGGSQITGQDPKEDLWKVRCVRKGPAPRCANPYGVEGQMLYNTDEDVVQYCDGARWIAIGKYE